MNAVSSVIPGIMGAIQRQGTGTQSTSTDFAGLLDSLAPALTSDAQPTKASAFTELGMFGHNRTQTETNPDAVAERHNAAPFEAVAACTPTQVPAMDDKSAAAPSPGPIVFATQQPLSLHSLDARSHDNGSQRYAVHTWRNSPSTAQPGLPFERMGQASAKSEQSGVQGSAPNTRPVTNAPAITGTAQPSVQTTMAIVNGQADIIVRGDVETRELAARIRAELAEHDLELAGLRLNGNDQPLQSQFQVGGNNGIRQRQ